MSNKGLWFDPHPNYRQAGKEIPIPKDESAGQYIHSDYEQQAPGTPKQIKKYLKSYKQLPAQTIKHYGKYDDQLPPDHFTYGKPTLSSYHVGDIFEGNGENKGFNELVTNIKEGKYASHKLEPLAKSLSRNYVLPEHVSNKNFSYGNKTAFNDYVAKDVIAPNNFPIEKEPEIKALYIKTHGNYESGEQKTRNYNWKFDPNEHVFGKEQTVIENGAKNCIQPDLALNKFPRTRLVQKNVEDYRNFKQEPIGKVKNIAQTITPNIGEDHVFGMTAKIKDEWNASKCIQGEPTEKDVQLDDDLGKTTQFGYRNITKEGDENRVFGVPTIRSDIKAPKLPSVADPNNYGSEPQVIELLFPEKFTFRGLSQEDFNELRTKNEIKNIFESVGIQYGKGKFEGVYMRAQQLCPKGGRKVSVNAFLQAVKQMHHMK